MACSAAAVKNTCYITHKWQQTADTHTHTQIIVVVYPSLAHPFNYYCDANLKAKTVSCIKMLLQGKTPTAVYYK